MKLVGCPECGRAIDLDDLEELVGDKVMGCGLNKGDYMPCEYCPEQNCPAECHAIRREKGFTKTTLAELLDKEFD